MTRPNTRIWLSSRSSTPAPFIPSVPPRLRRRGLRFRLFAMLLLAALALSACRESPESANEPSEAGAGAASTPEPVEAGTGAASALEPVERYNMYDAVPEMTIDPQAEYFATFKTDKGDMRVRLFADHAPVTVNNFIFLAREGYYNDTHFHRVLENFMAQGGDPTGSGAGGPGYQFQDEIVPSLQFDRAGLLAMANAGPDTNGSQFFITFAETPWLNGNHTIFGEVVEGTDVLFSLTIRDPAAGGASEFPGDLLMTIEIEQDEQ